MTTYMREGSTFRKRNHLPHLEIPGATYFVTFCLNDAITPGFFNRQREKRIEFLERIRKQFGAIKPADFRAIDKELRIELFEELDASGGSCVLARPEIGNLVASAIKFFDPERYRIIAYTVMPNHVHTIFRPADGIPWWKVVGGWKSFTAKEANRILGRSGTLWQDDNYDRVIRNVEHLENAIGYVLSNPMKAGLQNWPWVEQLVFAPYAEIEIRR